LKRFNTTKLFYGKYPYKIHWQTHFSNYFRGNDLTFIREVLDLYHQKYREEKVITFTKWRKTIHLHPNDLYKAQKAYQELSKNNNYKLRVENIGVAIYSTDKDWLKNLGRILEASEWWEPESTLEPNILVMGEKMRGWEYRITLGNSVPSEFFTWAIENQNKLKIGNKLRSLIKNNKNYLSGMYFYVRNEKMLSLVSLVLGRGIQRVDKIVIEDKNA